MMAATKYGCIGNGETSDLDFFALDYVNQFMIYCDALKEYK
jgi:hypothetical protein